MGTNPTPAPPRKILVIQTAFLGDIVLATPFLANLRALAPNAEILFLTTPAGARLLTPHEFRGQLLPYDKRGAEAGLAGFMRLSRRLRDFRPDLVFCLHRSIRSALLAKLSGGRIFGFREAAGSVLFDVRVSRAKGTFEAAKNQQLLEAWAGPAAATQGLVPRLALGEESEAVTLLEGIGTFVAIAPSSVWATKRWPPDRFARLALLLWRRRGWRVVIVGGAEPADREVAAKFLDAFRRIAQIGEPAPLDLTGKTGLGTLKSVLSRARLVVANDSAPLHIGTAVGAPVLGIFGPTTRDLGFFPHAPAGRAGTVEVAGLSCRPCGLHGHDACPKGHFRCMLEITPEAVLEEAEKLCP